jgi:hypothetical protein
MVSVCNSIDDCLDGSDESSCNNTNKLPVEELDCGNKLKCQNQCISDWLVCNGENDCSDGSDESNCSTHYPIDEQGGSIKERNCSSDDLDDSLLSDYLNQTDNSLFKLGLITHKTVEIVFEKRRFSQNNDTLQLPHYIVSVLKLTKTPVNAHTLTFQGFIGERLEIGDLSVARTYNFKIFLIV